ncbi:hypothetical protein HN51_005110 [Arachis hypogaea]
MKMQILFKYPLGKKLTVPRKELCSFCFPEGVKVCLKAICIYLDISNGTFSHCLLTKMLPFKLFTIVFHCLHLVPLN